MQRMNRLVIGISGASGAAIAIELLKQLQSRVDWETHLVISRGARRTIAMETDYSFAEVEALAAQCHAIEDVGASIASGTFKSAGMVVVPCSMKTVSGIAHGFSENLLLRAADVTIKERRKLILVARESPLSQIHLGNLLLLANMGVTILPPVLTFYNRPASIADMTRHIVGKILDSFGLEAAGFHRWGEHLPELPEDVRVA
jgi:4-hydroxy-3-polyprenylbenzoate decarboxylase